MVSTELFHPSPELSSTEYRDVQFSTEMSRYRVVQVPRCLEIVDAIVYQYTAANEICHLIGYTKFKS